MRSFYRLCAVLLGALLSSGAVAGPSTSFCVKEHMASNAADEEATSHNIAADEITSLIYKVGATITVDASAITIVPCNHELRAAAWYGQVEGAQAREYIVYNPTWTREVLGSNSEEITFVFGHELAHLLNRDSFEPRRSLPSLQKETDADRFGACAVARTGGQWHSVAAIIERLRDEVDSTHPSAARSLEAARAGFEACGGVISDGEVVELIATEPVEAYPEKGADVTSSFSPSLEKDGWTNEEEAPFGKEGWTGDLQIPGVEIGYLPTDDFDALPPETIGWVYFGKLNLDKSTWESTNVEVPERPGQIPQVGDIVVAKTDVNVRAGPAYEVGTQLYKSIGIIRANDTRVQVGRVKAWLFEGGWVVWIEALRL